MNAGKIAIIGAGAVGSAIAYTLASKNTNAEIFLIDIDQKRCKGEILDLSDALPFCQTSHIKSGSIKDAKNADIIIIAAGVRQKIDQPRIDLYRQNKKIFENIIAKLMPVKKEAIIIVVTNPVDLLTLQTLKLTKLPKTQVFGSGTILDSMRLRGLLAEKLNISMHSIHAYILGEHGETQFPAWTISSIAGVPITEFPGIKQNELDGLANKARNRVYDIIKCKGSTYYGVASCVTSLCENILFDQKKIIPLSCFIKELNVCLSMPCVLGIKGIEQIISIPLNTQEKELLKKSAQFLKKIL